MKAIDDVRVYVGPNHLPLLEDAVVRGGGRVVPLDEANAIVYHGSDDAREVVGMISDRILWIQLPHAGVERWTQPGYITEVPVWTSAAGAYSPQVAEHVLALMLLGAKGLHTLARATEWTSKNTRSLAGSTVAIIGAGGIGHSLVALLEPFGCVITAVSNSGSFAGAERTVSRDRYREILPDADYVVLTAPSTSETRGMIGTAELAAMKPGAWLINVARGDLVVTDQLVEALRAGEIAGAALDVTDPEPLPSDHPLWRLPNALITPHSANPEDAYWRTLAHRVEENVRRANEGRPLLAVIDPAVAG